MAQIIKLRFNDALGVEQISFPISVPEAILFKAEGDKAQQNLNEVIAAINTSITNIATEIGNSGDAANKEGSIYALINNLEQIIAEITGGDVNSIAAQIAAAIQGLGSASNGSLTAVTVGVNTEGKLTIAVDETALNAELAKFDTTLGVTRGGLISTTEGYAVNADSTVKEAINSLDSKLKSDVAAVTEGYEAADEALQANIDTKIGKDDIMLSEGEEGIHAANLQSIFFNEHTYFKTSKFVDEMSADEYYELRVGPFTADSCGETWSSSVEAYDSIFGSVMSEALTNTITTDQWHIYTIKDRKLIVETANEVDGERTFIKTYNVNGATSSLNPFVTSLSGCEIFGEYIEYIVDPNAFAYNTKESLEYLNTTKASQEQVNRLDNSIENLRSNVIQSIDSYTGNIYLDGSKSFGNVSLGVKIGGYNMSTGEDNKYITGTVDVGVETFKLSSEQESVDNVVLYDVNDWAPETGDASDYTNADVVFKHNEANDTIMGVAKIKNVNYEIKSVTPASSNVKEEYEFQKDGVKVGDSIKIYKDASLKSVELVDADSEGNAGQFLKFTHILADGSESDTYFNVSRLLVEAEFKNGLQVNEAGEVSVKVDTASEEFLTVGADGVKLSGVQDAIDTVDGKLTEHKNNTVAHITAEERAAWNAKVDFDVLKSVNYELDLTIFE